MICCVRILPLIIFQRIIGLIFPEIHLIFKPFNPLDVLILQPELLLAVEGVFFVLDFLPFSLVDVIVLVDEVTLVSEIFNFVVEGRILLLLFEKFVSHNNFFLDVFVLFGLFSHIFVFQLDLRTLRV